MPADLNHRHSERARCVACQAVTAAGKPTNCPDCPENARRCGVLLGWSEALAVTCALPNGHDGLHRAAFEAGSLMAEKAHRCGVVREDTGYYGVCSCGWRERFHFRAAAHREVKVHRRYPDGNPRTKAMREALDG